MATKKKSAAVDFSKSVADEMKKRKPLAKRSEAGLPVWKRNMNPEQLEVIMHDGGPLRVLAGAGSGKTRALVHRIARKVEQGHDPARILAVTFSKKAADEMNERLVQLKVGGARVGTWHSLCLQILREDNAVLAYEKNGREIRFKEFTVEDRNKPQSRYVLKDVIGFKHMNWKGADHGKLSRFIGTCKAKLIDSGDEAAMELARKEFGWEAKKAVEAYARFDELIVEKRLLTFDDMLVFVARWLAVEENRLNWSAKWNDVMQDEGQDANYAQVFIARLLAKDHRNYTIIGDVFQGIYGFRGADPLFLAEFDKDWPDAKTVWLGRNYRSGSKIIDAANNVIKDAKVGTFEPRTLIAERGVDGDVKALVGDTLDDEAKNFTGWVTDLVNNRGAKHSDITCLFRMNAQSRALEEALLSARIPYVVIGGVSFYERKVVRDLLAYLRVATDHGELEDIKRCINAPFRFLGAAFIDHVQNAAQKKKGSIDWPALVADVADNARDAYGRQIQQRQKDSAHEWAHMIAEIAERVRVGRLTRTKLRAQGVNVMDKLGAEDGIETTESADARAIRESRPSVILDDIIRRTLYIDFIQKEEGEESIETSGAADVREMVRVAERFDDADEMLDYIDDTIKKARTQREDKQAGGERVLLMTVHRSKGLEWPHVWVTGMNEMILPHHKGDEEEERRLAYVAMTRARDSLVLSYVRSMATRAGVKEAAPSRFLLASGVPLDMPADIIDLEGEAEAMAIEAAQI